MPTVPATAPDLAEIAREAVVGFLQEASAATAQQAAPVPSSQVAIRQPAELAGDAQRPADSVAWRAAALSVATLDRIEAAAAKVEEDIAAALRAQAELQAGAGVAAERAVRAAMAAADSSQAAAQSERGARVVLRRIERCLTITVLLLIVSIVILAVTAIPAG
jgi:hypothetical protein